MASKSIFLLRSPPLRSLLQMKAYLITESCYYNADTVSVWQHNFKFVNRTDMMGSATIQCTHNCTQNSDLTLMTPEIYIQLQDGTARPIKIIRQGNVDKFIRDHNMAGEVSISFGKSSTCENGKRDFWLELSGISTLQLNNSAYHCGVEVSSGEDTSGTVVHDYYARGICYLHINYPPPPTTPEPATTVTTGSTTAQASATTSTTTGATSTTGEGGSAVTPSTSTQPSSTQMPCSSTVESRTGSSTVASGTSSVPGSGATSGPSPTPPTSPPTIEGKI